MTTMDRSLTELSASLSVPRQATPRAARTVRRYEGAMVSDNLKLVFTYILTLVVVIGGGLMLYSIRLDPPETGSATLSLAVVGFIGLALGWAFNREAATQATRAAQSSSSQGADQAATIPHVIESDTTGR